MEQKVYVHRLVLWAFVGPCPKGKEASHKNGDNQDNRLTNLKWKNHTQNEIDKIKHGTSLRIFKDEDIREIRRLYKQGWNRNRIAKRFKAFYSVITPIVRNQTYKEVV